MIDMTHEVMNETYAVVNEMKITGLNRVGLDFALALGNANFAGNVKFEKIERKSDRTHLVRLSTNDNTQPGVKCYMSREAFDPMSVMKVRRRGPAACWHAHRDFIRAVFNINPEARVKSILTEYNCAEDFENDHETTKPTDRDGHCTCND